MILARPSTFCWALAGERVRQHGLARVKIELRAAETSTLTSSVPRTCNEAGAVQERREWNFLKGGILAENIVYLSLDMILANGDEAGQKPAALSQPDTFGFSAAACLTSP